MTGILGFGVISSLGENAGEHRRNLYGAPPLPHVPRRIKTALELPVFELDFMAGAEPDGPGGMTMCYLRRALKEALAAADITAAELAGERVGVCLGTTVACQLNDIPFYAELRTGKLPLPRAVKSYVGGCPADWVRRHLGLNGPALTVANACTSGADAIGIGGEWVRAGICDLAIVGGADEINQVPLVGFNALGVCSRRPCRPFDGDRDGLNLGEAGGILILASESYLKRRGRKAGFSLRGFGKSSDSFHVTQPDPSGDGLEKAISQALKTAGLTPDDLAFINAHGTGTRTNDQTEATVFSRLGSGKIPFMSTKGMTGHTLGAAGAIEAIFCCLMLSEGVAVRSSNFTESDDLPALPLRENRPVNRPFALSTSLAFGGANTALVIGREE